jgi:hypothetical protein
MQKETVYRCSKKCPIRKHCFVIKAQQPIAFQINVLQKCPAKKGRDILITIGGEIPP